MRFKARLISISESVRASYWFVPSLMALGAFALSFLMVWLDRLVPDEWLERVPWFYTGTADGARALLVTIASSMVGLAGVVFSITIVALTLASGQFGSRLLRNFMRDRGNQVTLGTFLSAFLYCLLVLRKVHGGGDDPRDVFIPQLSMLAAVVLAVAGLGVLIFFIHHAATSIQAPNVISAVTAELFLSIESLYPQRIGDRAESESRAETAGAQLPSDFEHDSEVVRAGSGGYLLCVEADQLLAVARQHDLIVRMEHRPGHFVQHDDVVLRVWPSARAPDDVLRELHLSFAIGDQRSLLQDAEFAIEQLVEVAARALSPGMNDPFTAINCVERLGSALTELAGRHFPSPYRMDEDGRLRVVAYPKTFSDFFDISYNQIRQYASKSLDVLLSMLEAFERIANHLWRVEDRQCLVEHAEMVYALATAAARADRDRKKVDSRYQDVHRALDAAPVGKSPLEE